MSGNSRHKVPRQFESGARKRAAAKEKKEKEEAVIKKTKTMLEFMPPSEKAQMPGPSNESGIAKTSIDITKADNLIDNQTTGTDPNDLPLQESITSNLGFTMGLPLKMKETDVMADSIELSPGCESDIGLWPEKPTEEMREFWSSKSSADVQHCSDDFAASVTQVVDKEGNVKVRKRSCTSHMFERLNRNGEKVKRSWLCYSPATGRVYCFACKLFTLNDMRVGPPQLAADGYNDWQHANRDLEAHEKSSAHTDCIIRLTQRAQYAGRIDNQMCQQISDEKKYWREVVKRLVSAIRLIAERGLAFRGDNENIGSPNNGNYLSILELIAEYDVFFAEHLRKHANKGSGHVNYLSSTICEELIEIIGETVQKTIVDRIIESKYYSLTVDSTPDNSHMDQLTCVLRYMERECPVERFLTFMDNRGHKGQEMADSLVAFLGEVGLDNGYSQLSWAIL